MKCDKVMGMLTFCKNTPIRAPRVIVPSKTWMEPGHLPLKMFTTLHYCEQHKCDIKLEDLLNAKIRGEFEDIAKKKRPLDFKCDFDAAFIEYILTTTPEYHAYMARLGANRIMQLAGQ